MNQKFSLLLAALLPAGLWAQKAVDTTGFGELKQAVEKNPHDMAAHQAFIKAAGLDGTTITEQYEKWMKQFPNDAMIPYALGHAYSGYERPEAKPWLLKAVAINDTLAEAWSDLSFDSERWGASADSREYMRKASASRPADPGYAFYYMMYFEYDEPAKWKSMVYDLAKKFPTSERGAQGLYWLANRSTDTAEKIEAGEKLKKDFPPSKFNWSSSGMDDLFNVYLAVDPSKALALAKEMGDKNGWAEKNTLAENMMKARTYLAQHNTNAAAEILPRIRAPRYSTAVELIELMKAQLLDATGKTANAYDSLLAFCAKKPGDQLHAELVRYGSTLGKTPGQVDGDLAKLRNAAKTPAPAFTLDQYLVKGKASLSDYKGKVVLLTFWFPGCGPCRGEFPHFETVMKRFEGKKVAYVAINVYPDQDAYVVPFMRGTHYTFTPLRSNSDWASKNYKVRGEPTNFLIDPNGNIAYTDFRASDPHSERMLELMIDSLLP